MKTLRLLLLACASATAQNWVPTFTEEFNGREVDLSKWTLHDPLSSLPDQSATGAVTVSAGQLHLASQRNPDTGRGRGSCIITTYGMFAQRYGRFEIRFRAPSESGLRSQFVLLPVPDGTLPKIEVFQAGEPRKVRFANQWGTDQTARSYGDTFTVADLSNGFHTAAIEWEHDHITWFLDGKKTFESRDGVPQQAMYLVMDLTWSGDHAGSSFDIDYVRVYKRAEQ